MKYPPRGRRVKGGALVLSEGGVIVTAMTEDLVLPVPEMLPAMYLVPVSMQRERAIELTGAALVRHVAEPVRGLTRRLLRTPALVITQRAAEVPDGEVIAFAALNPPRPGPVHEWTTRAASAAFAAELGLPLLDAFARQAMTAAEALGTLPGAPRLAAVGGGFRLADWVEVRQDERCLTTHGLGRFGLPELRLDDVPPELHPWWTVALTALGHRLLDLLRRELRRGAAAFVRVPELIGIRRTDIGSAYGLALADAGASVPVRLSLDPSVTDRLESHLSVDPAEHLLTISSTLLATGGAAPRARRSRHAAAARRRGAAAPARPTD